MGKDVEKIKKITNRSVLSYNLKRLRKERKLTLDELVEELEKRFGSKANKGMLSKWENGHQPNLDSLKMLSLFYKVSIDEMLGFDLQKEEIKIPVLKNINLDEEDVAEENIIGYGDLPVLTYYKENVIKDLFYLIITDDFMNKVYPESSIVLIRRNFPVRDGDNVLLKVDGQTEAIIGKLKRDENFIFLHPVSYNPTNTPIIIDTSKKSIKVIGKVIGCISMED